MKAHTATADLLLDQPTPVLNHGFIQLVDYMGNDEAIVQAARCSVGKTTKTLSDDRGLIRRLMCDKHTSPFEMVVFKFLCKMPIFVARQWIRHRTASVNEMSGRYSVLPDEFYIPEPVRVAYEAFQDYVLDSMTLSGPEIAYINTILTHEDFTVSNSTNLSQTEFSNLLNKIKKLGLKNLNASE
jgi:thymidylate synthase (FAD)